MLEVPKKKAAFEEPVVSGGFRNSVDGTGEIRGTSMLYSTNGCPATISALLSMGLGVGRKEK
jgi:hypothetical protein